MGRSSLFVGTLLDQHGGGGTRTPTRVDLQMSPWTMNFVFGVYWGCSVMGGQHDSGGKRFGRHVSPRPPLSPGKEVAGRL